MTLKFMKGTDEARRPGCETRGTLGCWQRVSPNPLDVPGKGSWELLRTTKETLALLLSCTKI